MKKGQFKKEINEILNHITVNIGERPTGSKSNRKVETYARTYFEKNGYITESQKFECIDWINNGAELILNGKELTAKPHIIQLAAIWKPISSFYQQLQSLKKVSYRIRLQF